MLSALLALAERMAMKSMRTFVLLMVALWSLGLLGASGGSAEAKFHSSSSFDVAAAGAGAGAGEGWLAGGFDEPLRKAKGSFDAGGGEKADCDGAWN